jgi:hypothetical protein
LAALIVASNLGARITGIGFIVFTVGSVSWTILGLTTEQPNLLWQNVVLTGLNLFGVWRWLGWQARIEEGGDAAARESRSEPGETLFPVSLLMKAKVVSRTAGTSAMRRRNGGLLERADCLSRGCGRRSGGSG